MYKQTNQRIIILELIKNNYAHPSVEEIYREAIKKLPRISKKTVYLTLQTLTQNNQIKEIKINGVKRYEPLQEEHIHAVCKQCNKVIDVKATTLIEETEKLRKKVKGFKVENTNTTLHGICKDCKEVEKNGK